LRRINSILSTIFGTEYPLGGLQWKRVNEAKDALASLSMPRGPNGRREPNTRGQHPMLHRQRLPLVSWHLGKHG
jgi:hypothetical protein